MQTQSPLFKFLDHQQGNLPGMDSDSSVCNQAKYCSMKSSGKTTVASSYSTMLVKTVPSPSRHVLANRFQQQLRIAVPKQPSQPKSSLTVGLARLHFMESETGSTIDGGGVTLKNVSVPKGTQ